MEQNIYIIRHCKAEGQYPDAALTEEGNGQTRELAEFLKDIQVDRIISSPFLRAKETIKPFAQKAGMEVEIDSRLAERHLDPSIVPDWLEWMRNSFTDLNLRDAGSESGYEATRRIAGVINDIIASDVENTVVVTHGGMITMLMHQYDESIGFEQWKNLSNPDVYAMKITDDHVSFNRIWK